MKNDYNAGYIKIKFFELKMFIKRLFCNHAYEVIKDMGSYPDQIQISQCVDCKKIIIIK